MTRWEWTQAGLCAAAAMTLIFAGSWFSGQIVKVAYPNRSGYSIEGVAPVDLAAIQRSWPSGLQQPGDPAELRGYIDNIEKAVLPVPQGGLSATAAAAPVDLGTLLAGADAGRGKGAARVCASCHTFDQGGPNRVGPNLWAVVGRTVGGHGGYAYSPAIRSHGGAWTYQELDRYLAGPARAIPGNKMAFSGLRNPRDRANLLAYLGSLSPSPAPFPAPQPAAVPETAGGAATTSR